MRNLKKEISREMLKYKMKYGHGGAILILGEEEWSLFHSEEKPPFEVSYNKEGEMDTLYNLVVYKSHTPSLVMVAGKESAAKKELKPSCLSCPESPSYEVISYDDEEGNCVHLKNKVLFCRGCFVEVLNNYKNIKWNLIKS